MLTVWCLWWRDPAAPNKYDAYCVQRLQREVKKYLTVPHHFICITDEDVPGVDTMPPPVPWPGWWGKLGLFKPGVAGAYNLWLDLDVVITGSLDDLVQTYHESPLAMPLNWAQSGHGGCQSSVMVWAQTRHTLQLYKDFDPDDAHWPPVNRPGVCWGDQEFITAKRDAGDLRVEPIRPNWVRSYKYHCQGGLPDDCRVVLFHGEPKPQNVQASWFTW